MAIVDVPQGAIPDRERVRDEWLERLNALIDDVDRWARGLGWSTRRIEKTLDDREIGAHKVPALVLQENTVRLLLDPIGRSGPGTDGIVDFYLMPGWDDVARFYLDDKGWQVLDLPADAPAALKPGPTPLTEETFRPILDAILRHAS